MLTGVTLTQRRIIPRSPYLYFSNPEVENKTNADCELSAKKRDLRVCLALILFNSAENDVKKAVRSKKEKCRM